MTSTNLSDKLNPFASWNLVLIYPIYIVIEIYAWPRKAQSRKIHHCVYLSPYKLFFSHRSHNCGWLLFSRYLNVDSQNVATLSTAQNMVSKLLHLGVISRIEKDFIGCLVKKSNSQGMGHLMRKLPTWLFLGTLFYYFQVVNYIDEVGQYTVQYWNIFIRQCNVFILFLQPIHLASLNKVISTQ